MPPVSTIARRTFADARVRLLSFGAFFLVYAIANTLGYAREFPTVGERVNFSRNFGNNPALELFYGAPRNLETVGGYAAWRVGGVLSIVCAFFGLWAAVRALRGEEESGRQELVLACAVGRNRAFAARLVAVAALVALLWLAILAGLLAGGLALGGSAFLALAIVSTAVVYAGIGAVTSQFVESGRGALELGGTFLLVDLLVRVVADTANHPRLHWAMPLGWVEGMRAFTAARPLLLLLPLAATIALLLIAAALQRHRDVGIGLLAGHDGTREPRLRLHDSLLRLALRAEAVALFVWIAATAGFGFVLGQLAKSFTTADLGTVREQLDKFGADITSASGVLGLYFLFFVLAIALYCCGQLSALRGEEAAMRLETLFALPVDRTRWFAGRLGFAAVGAALIGLAAGLGAAAGAAATGAGVSFRAMIEAGLNCLPASLLFLGLGALLVAWMPRHGVGIVYALVSLAFMWELIGDLVGMPSWLLGVSPFHQIALVPAQPFRATAAAIMLALGLAAAAGALLRFRGRDLTGV